MSVRFLSRQLIEHLHKRQIEKFGGSFGLRDEGALEAAIMRPMNKASYGTVDIVELGAAYLYGLAMNHAFIDGNKRIAIVSAGVFLMDNGYAIETDDGILYKFVISISAGEIDEDGATRFLRDHTVPYP
ncbi:type II toxin-antitoxin system death-on-curing family toxin [Rhizobium sp. XQZ8]|uniref:type II toxin-antitoxin system death-on-curing family toxin n=1 Tax=Rhizobium populisoli TaxID=2859785 RepID=UPI001CA567B1|nr:type II toxin-antitoxin system death-on-curing family toxin [Rhizobium populisoli]MBW6420480.1 type II toxin-antitoxin system death-on-curing family toxin [Rhizobium populisoli]